MEITKSNHFSPISCVERGPLTFKSQPGVCDIKLTEIVFKDILESNLNQLGKKTFHERNPH